MSRTETTDIENDLTPQVRPLSSAYKEHLNSSQARQVTISIVSGRLHAFHLNVATQLNVPVHILLPHYCPVLCGQIKGFFLKKESVLL